MTPSDRQQTEGKPRTIFIPKGMFEVCSEYSSQSKPDDIAVILKSDYDKLQSENQELEAKNTNLNSMIIEQTLEKSYNYEGIEMHFEQKIKALDSQLSEANETIEKLRERISELMQTPCHVPELHSLKAENELLRLRELWLKEQRNHMIGAFSAVKDLGDSYVDEKIKLDDKAIEQLSGMKSEALAKCAKGENV